MPCLNNSHKASCHSPTHFFIILYLQVPGVLLLLQIQIYHGRLEMREAAGCVYLYCICVIITACKPQIELLFYFLHSVINSARKECPLRLIECLNR